MKRLSFSFTSDHLLLFILLSLLWGVADTNGTNTSLTTPKTTTTTTTTTTKPSASTATSLTTPSTTKQQPPENVKNVTVLGRGVSSITLRWDKVKGISTYILLYDGGSTSINMSTPEVSVSALKAGTKYNFTLFTVFNGVNSTGYTFDAVTVPNNAEWFKSVGQNETSIILQWKKVDGIINYVLSYNDQTINVSATENNETVTRTVSPLSNGTQYNFTLFTVFENVLSTGVNLIAATAPVNAKDFSSVGQNETSITLQWKKVDGIINYVLSYNDQTINVSATENNETVTRTVSPLSNGTQYNFTLFTVFENVLSTGVNLIAATQPRNTDMFTWVGQNETSITLQWKKVDTIINYVLEFNGQEPKVNATQNENVTYTASNLISGTIYDFALFTVFQNVRSTGVNLTAATAPRNTDVFTLVGQNETSITLQWKKVDAIINYVLRFSDQDTNVIATQSETVTYTASDLINGTIYDFTLFTVFENVRSTGVNLTAATVPLNAEGFKSVGQDETSITLQWERVADILNYSLQIDKIEIPVTVNRSQPLTFTVPDLESGTKYQFVLFTLFANVKSRGVNISAVTAPENVKNVTVRRGVSSITLMWDKVNGISTYILQYDGGSTSINTSPQEASVSHNVSALKAGTKYHFTVITVFERVNSSGERVSAVTAIDCASVPWHVSNSSIQGVVDGLFTNATATNASQTYVSVDGRNVSFSGLYPGATYEISLVYEADEQCRHSLTILPPDLRAHCKYWASGYSIRVEWNKPDGLWTEVQLNVTGQTHRTTESFIVIPGFSPAKSYEVSVASLSGTLRSAVPFIFQCSTDPRGVIAGSVFGLLLMGFLVCLVVFILLKRPDLISRKSQFTSGSALTTTKSNAISVEVFAEHCHQLSVDDNRGFSIEYESFIPVGTEQTRKAALLPDNKPKNRFNNVLPYDWCRVKLTTSTGTADYINANYMPGYNRNMEYIATQGPLPSTVNDFWRMIWEQKVKAIVMVTNCTEGGRTKCEQYWPADSNPRLYGELSLTVRSEEQEPNWTLREFTLKHRETTEQRTVKHFHFTSWPDHGVPQCTEVLIQFRGLLRHHIEAEGTKAPTVVHCSAGVGRTGTIIALDVLLQQLEKKGAVDINGVVHKMRLNRPHMVQTESQYIFLHQCIMDSLQPEEKTDEHVYENTDMIYVNATALQEFRRNTNV